MAYTAKNYQRTWTYDPQGTDFNAEVGRILAQGRDLKRHMSLRALDTLNSNLEFEKENSGKASGTVNPDFYKQTSDSGSKPPSREHPGKGYTWVDEKGRTLGPVVPAGSKPGTPSATAASAAAATTGGANSGTSSLSPAQQKYTTMNPTQRSMHMWRRVNPGCMEPSLKVPISTMKEHFTWDDRLVEAADMTHHLKKNDFTEYSEVKLRLMHHISDH